MIVKNMMINPSWYSLQYIQIFNTTNSLNTVPVLVKSAMKTNERKWLKHTCIYLGCCLTSITDYCCGVHVLDQRVGFQAFGFEQDYALD